MPHAEFVHLRTHSAYSLSEGALRVKDLIALCQRHRMPAVGVTDTNNLFGALELSLGARSAGVQPIIGVQLGLRRTDAGNGGRHIHAGFLPPDELVLLAQSEKGYENILSLVSQAFLDSDAGEPAQVDIEDLPGRSEGIIALTGGPNGPVGRLIANGQGPAAEEVLMRLASIYENRLYVELMRHNLEVETGLKVISSISPIVITYHWWRPIRHSSPTKACTRRMMRFCVFRRACRYPNKIAAAPRRTIVLSRRKKCGFCSRTCRKRSTIR